MDGRWNCLHKSVNIQRSVLVSPFSPTPVSFFLSLPRPVLGADDDDDNRILQNDRVPFQTRNHRRSFIFTLGECPVVLSRLGKPERGSPQSNWS